MKISPIRIRGFSLVELMVALVIGLIITAAVATIFSNTKRAYNAQERLSRVQENGRFAMEYLLRDLRMAGYMGCWTGKLPVSTKQDVWATARFHNALNIATPGFTHLLSLPIEGFDGDATPAQTAWSPSGDKTSLPADREPGTDMFTIRMLDDAGSTYLTAPMAAKHSPLQVDSVEHIKAGDILIVADCSGADLFQVTGVQTSPPAILHATGSETPGNKTPQLRKEYGGDALDASNTVTPNAVKIGKAVTRTYFIRRNPNDIPSLYVSENGGTPIELVEGIEDMQVLYGVDKTSGAADDGIRAPNQYLRAGAPGLQTDAEWAGVVSMRIGLLARTLTDNDAAVDANESYNVNGKTVSRPSGDRHQRRVFEATVNLRNRELR